MQYKGTDKMQHLHIHTKADGKTKTHHYENPHRNELTRVTYSDGEPQRSFTYHTSGLAHTAANAHSTITWGYDAAGRKTSETQALQGVPGTHTFAYSYDGDGNLESHTRPDGSVVDYGYDLRNLLKDITADTAPPVAAYTYNGRNQLHQTGIEDGNLFTATRSYDGAGRLSGISNGALDSTGYTLSPDGRRTGITRNGQSETYGYDAARQVESATYGGLSTTQSWNYDAAANRSSATTNGVTTSYFANAVNEYTSITGFPAAPTHDPNGNALNWNVRPGGLPSSSLVSCVLSWNIHNEMTAATNANGDTAEYQYDALGRRTKRTETISGVTTSTWFLINGWNVELEYEFGAYARRLTWGQDLSQTLQGAGGVGGLIMSEELPPGGGAPVPSFPTYDGNGNITAWVNASGTVTARQRYDAFGNVIEQTGTAPSRYGFSTKPIELFTGFLYYGYRYYDPVTGRWPSRDPIEENGGINLYGFVFNNPFKWIDRLGLSAGETITVEKSEAYLIIDHGSRKNPIKWKFNSKCSVGGAVVCFPEANNSTPTNNKWPNLPKHNNELIVPDDVADTNSGDQSIIDNNSMYDDGSDKFYKPEDREHSFDEVMRNALKPNSLLEIKDRLCKCCDEIWIVVDFRTDGGDGGNDGRFGFGVKPKKWKYLIRCP